MEGLNNMLKSAVMLNPRLLRQCPNGCQSVDLRDTVANEPLAASTFFGNTNPEVIPMATKSS